MTDKIEQFLTYSQPSTPCLVVDLDRVSENYQSMAAMTAWDEIFYAVKANPASAVIETLAAFGASFDAASPAEIATCVAAGIAPTRISYGNTIKKSVDIAFAVGHGIDLFAFDSSGELDKLEAQAPGARVICRIAVSNEGARWPLTRKFGCDPAEVVALLRRAVAAGLRPVGLSFHTGSQQTESSRWCQAIAQCGQLFAQSDAAGIPLELLNLGGGFPVAYGDGYVPALDDVAAEIDRAIGDAFGGRRPRIIIEPGRTIVADAGLILSEVVLVTQRAYNRMERWVYLDVGRYGGLAECEGEAIRYRMTASGHVGPDGPVVVAGPTCDSHDVMYEKSMCALPIALSVGDLVTLHDTGAYTSSYASVGFNGFAPLEEYFI
ncbi:MAG: ornithine decarboxylase [Alphaproteobacteria bacterium]|nr:ornithine decarboxylase [Alphaproteobacteria bacterium]HCP00765.1 ornithine decarboxylase [Rhodospirillaceae bacterium]